MTTLINVCPLPSCWGFLDGTLRPITCPSRFQEITYSGHKRIHGIKLQSVVTPNGLIAILSGPYESKRHDAVMFRESGLRATGILQTDNRTACTEMLPMP